jgi:hypothetical protein
MDEYFKWTLIVFGILVFILLLTKLPSIHAGKAEHVPVKILQEIVNEARKLAYTTRQDGNVLVALMHSTTGLSLVNALQTVDVSHKLAKKLDVDLEALRSQLAKLQSDKLREIADLYPDLRIEDPLQWA